MNFGMDFAFYGPLMTLVFLLYNLGLIWHGNDSDCSWRLP